MDPNLGHEYLFKIYWFCIKEEIFSNYEKPKVFSALVDILPLDPDPES